MKIQNTNNRQSFGQVTPIVKNMTAGEISLINKHSNLLTDTFKGVLARISVDKKDWRKFVFSVSEIPKTIWGRLKLSLGIGVVKTKSGNMNGVIVDDTNPVYDSKFIDVVREALIAYKKDAGVVARAERAEAKRAQEAAASLEAEQRGVVLKHVRANFPNVEE